MGILFFVLSAQAPLTGIVGAAPLAAALGNGAGAPGAYLVVGIVIVIFAVGFVAMSRKVQTNGAFYAYVTAAFGRKVGAGAAWLALLAYSTVQAAMYGLYGAAFSGLLASVRGVAVPWWLLALATHGRRPGPRIHEHRARCPRPCRIGGPGSGHPPDVRILCALQRRRTRRAEPRRLVRAGSHRQRELRGVAIMFAVASMFCFPIHQPPTPPKGQRPAPDCGPVRFLPLPRASSQSSFSFITWMLVSFYGPSHVADAAGAALESGDATSFVDVAFRRNVRALGRHGDCRSPADNFAAGRHHCLPQRHQPLPAFAGPARLHARQLWPGPTSTVHRPPRPGSRPWSQPCWWRRSPCRALTRC